MVALNNFLATIRDFMELGGDVLWVIMAVLFFMWVFIIERYWYLLRVHPQRRRAIVADWEDRSDTSSWYAKRIREEWVSRAKLGLYQNINTIKVLIAVCPLLGLLGTVTGMIGVFDVMGFSGTGNARAMAGGVSKATIPTMAGMVSALSGIYFSTHLEQRAEAETERLEDLLHQH